MNEIARGAEAVIFQDGRNIVKDRMKKSYRHPELDAELRKQRTRRESNLLRKLSIPHPKLISTDEKEMIVIELIIGQKVRDVLDSRGSWARKIGELVAEIHNQDIIHGDLTTSNMILDEHARIVFIDFGLSFQSQKVEDKAVDIHLFKQALDSKHFKVYDAALKEFLKGYSKAKQAKETLSRLEEVELRGRYRKG